MWAPTFPGDWGDGVIISWKPNPARLTQRFDEDFIRTQLDEGMRTLRGKHFEVVLVDLRSCGGHPENITRRVGLVRESMNAACSEILRAPGRRQSFDTLQKAAARRSGSNLRAAALCRGIV